MTPPLTGYELRGDWTTITEETPFLEQVVTETDARHTVIAHDAVGNPIHRIDLGVTDGPTVLIVVLQHGREAAPREAALIHLRDLAYSTDPAVLDYLASHRVVYIPTANPSAHPDDRSGVGSVDINRAHVSLERLEAQGIAETIAEVDPHIILDMHEYTAPGGPEVNDHTPDHWGDFSRLPTQAPEMWAAGETLYEDLNQGLEAQGISTGKYPEWALGMLHPAASLWDCIGLLSETHRTLTLPRRVDIGISVIDEVLAWHTDHIFECERAKIEARRYGMQTTDYFAMISNTISSKTYADLAISGYQLDGPLPDRAVLFGVEQDSNFFVPLNQIRRAAVPYLFDPESPYAVVQGARVPRPPETPRGEPVRWRINVDGLVRDVKKAWINAGEGVRAVRVPGA